MVSWGLGATGLSAIERHTHLQIAHVTWLSEETLLETKIHCSILEYFVQYSAILQYISSMTLVNIISFCERSCTFFVLQFFKFYFIFANLLCRIRWHTSLFAETILICNADNLTKTFIGLFLHNKAESGDGHAKTSYM